jgi:hypothetical protein
MNNHRLNGCLISAICLVANSTAIANTCIEGSVPNWAIGDYLPLPHDDWSPYKGYLVVTSDNTLEVSIRFNQTAINVLKLRKDFALDIDIVDFNRILGKENLRGETISDPIGGSWENGQSWSFEYKGFPDGVLLKKDTGASDNIQQMSVIILNPHLLKAEEEYKIRFTLDRPITSNGKLKLNMDLSVNFVGSGICFNAPYRIWDFQSPWNYWKLETEQYREFLYYPHSTAGSCWENQQGKKKDSGFKYCYETEPKPANLGSNGFPGYDSPNATNPPQTPPIGSSPQPIPGKRTDLQPDFDVFNTEGNEISANCDHCSGKPIDPGQTVRTRLTVEVSNANASKNNRNDEHKKIDGRVWWKIEGKTGWKSINRGEYTIKKLKKGKKISETRDWSVPSDYPGDILAMKACVDTDDEIWEQNEDKKKKKITDPDQDGTTNNCSRTERFYIRPPETAQDDTQAESQTGIVSNNAPTGAVENGDCAKVTGWAKDQDTPGSLEVKVFTANPDGTNEQYLESLVAAADRADLGGEYGIDWTVPLSFQDRQARKVVFYATNVPEGSNPVLGSVTLTCPDDAAEQEPADSSNTPPATPPVTPPPPDPPVVPPSSNTTDLIVSSLGIKEGSVVDHNSVIHPVCVIRNVGNVTPSSGIRSAYYIDDVYRADDGSDAENLTPGHDQQEEVLNDDIRADTAGTRTLKCCADYQGSVSESDEGNNCATATFEVRPPVAPPPTGPDLIISSLGFKEGTSIKSGTRVHPYCVIRNIGNATPSSNIRTAYYIDDKYRMDDGSDASELTPGRDQWEEVLNDDIKLGETGDRKLKCCADYQGSVSELDEGNNCASIGFNVHK